MTERLIEKLDRLGSEAGVEKMTPEIRRFAMLVRADTAAAWPSPPRPWVGLTEEQREACTQSPFTEDNYEDIEAKLKELNT
jgi:uncharacterized protein YeaC (DUF1315 family)